MATTPITSPPNNGVWVGNVPAVAGTGCLRAIEPAIASTGMMRKKRPTSMAMPSVVSYHCVAVVRPAKAEPLLLDADVKAYRISDSP
jgi:hypothetical protein